MAAVINEPIVFFGSGPVAAESLRLLAQNFEIEAVVTKPQPPHHKEVFPVLAVAEELSLPIKTTINKAELASLFDGATFKSRLGIVIDYGIIIPQAVIDYFELGIVNSHFSLLPQWRGADPITFSILSGQKQTGVSLMLIVEALDEGPLLAQSAYDITAETTGPSLTHDLIALSNDMLVKVLPLYVSGEAKPADQLEASMLEDKTPSYSRKLAKQDGILDYTKPAAELERQIRAFTGWPRSRTAIGTTEVVITKAHIGEGGGTPGTLYLGERQLGMHCAEGVIIFDSLIPAGKKEMSAQAFLAGYTPGA